MQFYTFSSSTVVSTLYTILYFRKTFTSTSCFLRDQVQSESRHCYQLKFTQKYKHFNWYFCRISYFVIESCSDKIVRCQKYIWIIWKGKNFWLYICTISVTQTERKFKDKWSSKTLTLSPTVRIFQKEESGYFNKKFLFDLILHMQKYPINAKNVFFK